MNKNIYKNGGFPPIIFCKKLDNNIKSNERYYASDTNNDFNIRLLLKNNNKKEQLFIPKVESEDFLQVIDSL